VALAALEQLVAHVDVRPDDRVVVISTAHGLKFTDFKVGYHEATLDNVKSRHANPPVELPAAFDAVQDTLTNLLGPA
jgi:threonine synthase